MTLSLQTFKPAADKIFVTDLERGEQKTAGGIILKDDDMTERGIRPRWGRVLMTGKDVTDVKVGEWVLMEHGRWSFGMDFDDNGATVKVWHVDPKGMMLVSEKNPNQ